MTCQQFAASGKTTGLTELKYTVKKGKISSLSPTTVTFFEKFTATKASFPLVISQSNTGAWVPLATIKGTAVTLYDVNCVKSSAQGSTIYDPATGTVTLYINGATPGAVYYIAIKYNPLSVVGTPVSTPYPTVTYNFVTSADGVPLPTGVVNLKVKPK